jgi:hypothetical protein
MESSLSASETVLERPARSFDDPAAKQRNVALLCVVAGGFSLGFFLWYLLVVHTPIGGAAAQLLLLGALPGGPTLAVLAWRYYSRYISRKFNAPLARVQAYDALSWSALAFFWVGFIPGLGPSATGRWLGIGIGVFCVLKLLAAARFDVTVRDVLATFLVTRLPLIVIAELASTIIGQRAGTHVAVSQNPLLVVWGRWDATHYLDIATRGYYGTDVAFFPLYPALIAGLGKLAGNHVVGGLVISNVACFVGLLYFYKLVEHQYDRAVAHRATFYISIFPTAIFFSAVYTESLFFALTVASFYFIRERKFIIAGVIGYYAAMTRVEGVLLIAPLVIEAIPAVRANVRRLIPVLVSAALIMGGLATFMWYLWVIHGDPLYFSHVQEHWHRHLAPPWVSVWHSFHLITTSRMPQTIATQVIELSFTALMLVMLGASLGRLRWSYWVYMALSIVIPMCTSSLMSMPRFALVLFPMFVLFAIWGKNAVVNNTVVAFSLSLLGLFTVLFANWYWVA